MKFYAFENFKVYLIKCKKSKTMSLPPAERGHWGTKNFYCIYEKVSKTHVSFI